MYKENEKWYMNLLFSKRFYTKLEKEVDDLKSERISDFNELEKTVTFGYYYRILINGYWSCIFLEIFNAFRYNEECYSFRSKRLYPILRIALLTKLYYLFFVYKFN